MEHTKYCRFGEQKLLAEPNLRYELGTCIMAGVREITKIECYVIPNPESKNEMYPLTLFMTSNELKNNIFECSVLPVRVGNTSYGSMRQWVHFKPTYLGQIVLKFAIESVRSYEYPPTVIIFVSWNSG